MAFCGLFSRKKRRTSEKTTGSVSTYNSTPAVQVHQNPPNKPATTTTSSATRYKTYGGSSSGYRPAGSGYSNNYNSTAINSMLATSLSPDSGPTTHYHSGHNSHHHHSNDHGGSHSYSSGGGGGGGGYSSYSSGGDGGGGGGGGSSGGDGGGGGGGC